MSTEHPARQAGQDAMSKAEEFIRDIASAVDQLVAWDDSNATYSSKRMFAQLLMERVRFKTNAVARKAGELQAVVDKLPRTKDGAPIYPGMKLWIINSETMKPIAWTVTEVGASWVMVKERSHEMGELALQSAWSTREACAAALATVAPSTSETRTEGQTPAHIAAD